MNTLELSIAFQTNKPLSEYARIAQKVEMFGFDMISVYNDLWYQPAWLPLFEMASATDSIKLGVAAVNPFTSHPINIAGNAALLDEKSNGRSYLGIARGAWLDSLGLYPIKPITQLKQAITGIIHLLSQSNEKFESEFFPIMGNESLKWNIPRSKIPILLGSWGLKTIEACFSLINSIKIGGTANPGITQIYASRLKEHASFYGNDVNLVVGAVCVVDEDSEKAKYKAKKEVALYLPVVLDLDSTLSFSSSIVEGITEAMKTYDYDTACDYITDDMLSKFAFAGNPEEISKQIISLYDAGAQRVELGTPHGLTMDSGVDLLGKEVLPTVKLHLDTKFG